ncbi:MAG: DEAD/DEAH box helicase family protein [Flavobacteriales bacterium]|nr:DEAD/DEAH box helicase family protein [Flavobacteriales bacterium]
MTEALPIDEAIAKRMQSKKGKELYGYQKNAIDTIMSRIRKFPEGYNLLYQLPTGGGKTVIFSELAKRFILETGKRVLILTHRIELLGQTSSMLTEIGVPNKIINSKVKELEDSDDHWCFVAMVETLNNRLNDEQIEFADLGLVVVDEAHYNSFRKLFKHFDSQILLGVTATPLSSNIKLPLHDNYSELIVGESIANLVGQGFLAKAGTYSYDVNLRALKVGINGDYTVSSSERLYGNFLMQEKLLYAYEEKAKGTKTLIFNNGINTSKQVQAMFEEEGYACMHLDNTHSEKERADILHWFHTTPDAVLSSVSILTTGFDEPSVETIILNRATKSLTLYHQMIGRGSRILKHKSAFTVIDLGNNARRFGLWDAHINWHDIFKSPQSYIDGLYTDEEIEEEFVYEMPEELAERFKGGPEMTFDMAETYAEVTRMALRPKEAIHRSMAQHVAMIQHASDDYWDAVEIVDLLGDDIKFRVKQYAKCIAKATANYRSWLEEEYTRNLKTSLRHAFNDEE